MNPAETAPSVQPLDYAPQRHRRADVRYRIRLASIVTLGVSALLPVIGRLPDRVLRECQPKLDVIALIATIVALTALALTWIRPSSPDRQ